MQPHYITVSERHKNIFYFYKVNKNLGERFFILVSCTVNLKCNLPTELLFSPQLTT